MKKQISIASFNNTCSKSEYTTTSELYTVSVDVQIHGFTHINCFSLDVDNIKEKHESLVKTDHRLFSSPACRGDDLFSFKGYSALLWHAYQYDTRTR